MEDSKTTTIANNENDSQSKKLQSNWTMWLDKHNKKEKTDFKENLLVLGSFDNIEAFVGHYAFLAKPSTLPKSSSLNIFRGDVEPMWESYPNGGCWIIKLKKNHPLLNLIWEQLIFSAVCEEFEEPDLVGITISIKHKEDVFAIWNRDNSIPRVRLAIGTKLKTILHLGHDVVISYKHNKKSLKDRSTFRNAKSFVIVESPTSEMPKSHTFQNMEKVEQMGDLEEAVLDSPSSAEQLPTSA